MKKLLLLSLLSLSSFAQEAPPQWMKDGVITVKLKDGKEYKFSTNEFKVVKRGSKTKQEAAPQVTPVASAPTKTPAAKPNRLMVHGGVGFDGLSTKVNSNDVVVKEKREPVFGLSYQRLVVDDVSFGASIFTNETFLLGVGKDF